MPSHRESRATIIVTAILAVLILVPSLWGFGMKLTEFIALVRGDVDGVFAISPVANYLLASIGFFCLLLWATLNGMFRDIEEPKYHMLEQEQQLDEVSTATTTDKQN